MAARRLGLDVLGIEWDQAACDTRRAAGLPTVQGDVRDYGPARFPARGLVASPPCQTFSTAGRGAGRAALDKVLALAGHVAATGLAPARGTFDDERTSLVLEPLRWVARAYLTGRPYEWVACEQVPTVLPVWEHYAELMRGMGYSVAAGYLHAEQYGVPQTRKRAVLVARLHGQAHLPEPTHSRYHARTPDRLDPGVLPWVSMADALGPQGGASMHTSGASCKTCPPRHESEPSRTILGGGQATWLVPAIPGETAEDCARTEARPSPTIVGPFAPDVVAAPGWRKPGDGPRQKAPGSVRVTPQQAAALQTFPPDHPWQGSRTKVYQQIGNAIPPLLAQAVLAEVAR